MPVVEPDRWCRCCGTEGLVRDTVIRRLAHGPHGWRSTVVEVVVRRWRENKYVIVIIDLTPVREGTGPARLLDLVEGRSRQAVKTWLADCRQAWCDGVEVVAMNGFTGFKTAAAEEVPDAVAVMEKFHVVRLAGDALDR